MISAVEAVIAARDTLGRDVQVAAAATPHPDLFRVSTEDIQRHLAFIVNDLAQVQGFLITAALYLFDIYPLPVEFVNDTTFLLGDPFVVDNEQSNLSPALRRELAARATAILNAPDEWEE